VAGVFAAVFGFLVLAGILSAVALLLTRRHSPQWVYMAVFVPAMAFGVASLMALTFFAIPSARAANEPPFQANIPTPAPGTTPTPGTTPSGGAVASKVSGQPAAQTVNETDSFKFVPASIRVKAGDVVEWVDSGTSIHNVTFANSAVPTSATMNSGDKYEIKFQKAGTYSYECTFHVALGMTGKVVVGP
jgi:plastocyanin